MSARRQSAGASRPAISTWPPARSRPSIACAMKLAVGGHHRGCADRASLPRSARDSRAPTRAAPPEPTPAGERGRAGAGADGGRIASDLAVGRRHGTKASGLDPKACRACLTRAHPVTARASPARRHRPRGSRQLPASADEDAQGVTRMEVGFSLAQRRGVPFLPTARRSGPRKYSPSERLGFRTRRASGTRAADRAASISSGTFASAASCRCSAGASRSSERRHRPFAARAPRSIPRRGSAAATAGPGQVGPAAPQAGPAGR
jgi:hypothetical protein